MTKQELLKRLRKLELQAINRQKNNKLHDSRSRAKGAERSYRNAIELVELLGDITTNHRHEQP